MLWRRQEHVCRCSYEGDFSAALRKFRALGGYLKLNVWGGSGKPKFGKNRACLALVADHGNSVKDRYFVKLATNTCILDDFRHKSHQKQPIDRLKVAFLTSNQPL